MDKEILETLKSMQSDITEIKSKQEEIYQIVKALEHSAEVNKAQHDKIGNDITHIKGNVEIITSSNWNDLAKIKAVK